MPLLFGPLLLFSQFQGLFLPPQSFLVLLQLLLLFSLLLVFLELLNQLESLTTLFFVFVHWAARLLVDEPDLEVF